MLRTQKDCAASKVDSSVLDRVLTGDQLVREFVHRSSAYDVNLIRFKNPFIPGIRFTVGTGLLIFCAAINAVPYGKLNKSSSLQTFQVKQPVRVPC